ncbi:E3 ubiquitin/ISG15 ligase TRIM25-like [Mantella aurantiaca]
MASADLRTELECSVCLNIYADPVMLRCGHNFCRVCIDCVFVTQEESGGYSCPECRAEFQERPAPQRNLKLRNIVENFLTARPNQESGVFCTYCIHTPVPAVKSCLLCEASLCDNHLRVHSRLPEHVLCDPTATPQNRKCSVHKELFKYYCTEDSACICVSCCLIGEHKGHEMKSLDEASEAKKHTLRNAISTLMTKKEKTEKRIKSLRNRKIHLENKISGDIKSISDLLKDLRKQLEDLEKGVLSKLSAQAEKVSLSLNMQIFKLEKKKDDLSRKMCHIEELCNTTDPLTVLQVSDSGDLCDTEDRDNKDRERPGHFHDDSDLDWAKFGIQLDDRKRGVDKRLYDEGNLDVAGISHTLYTLSDIITMLKKGAYIKESTEILLDEDTAHNILKISDDRKTVSKSRNQNILETPERFKDYNQVMSSRSFLSGRHYWEVDVHQSRYWTVGMCYPSVDRRAQKSKIGSSEKSWGLERDDDQYSVIHNGNKIQLPDNISSNRVRIYLDYEAGQISCYSLSHPIRHLHTFISTFTEPLHAVLGIRDPGLCVGSLRAARISVI